MNYFIGAAIIALLLVAGAGIGSYYGAKKAIEQKKFVIKLDEKKGEATLEPVPKTTSKAEFIEDATAEQLAEMDQLSGWKRFFKRFVKPRKDE
jgi:hypothetical protein|tara:strand:+ start:295 stop:573 length:279 start_codon:yes stop_codon:yes gene_type:complete